MMGDYKRALYDYSAAILNDEKYPKWNTLVPGVGGAPTYYSKFQNFTRLISSLNSVWRHLQLQLGLIRGGAGAL